MGVRQDTRDGARKRSVRQAAWICLPSLLILAAGVWILHLEAERLYRQTEQALTAVARLKVDEIGHWRRERLSDAGSLMDDRPLMESAVRYLADQSSVTARKHLVSRFESLRRHYGYRGILLVDSEGRILLGRTDEAGTIDHALEQTLREAAAGRRPVLTDIHTTPNHLDPHLGVVLPVFSGEDTDARFAGGIVLQEGAGQFLFPLLQSWPTPSRSAETLLVRREGDTVLFLNNVRHQPDSALAMSIPANRTDLPAAMAVAGKRGTTRGRDYRGVDVLAVLAPVPDTPWFMVAKVDAAEALSVLRVHSVLILLVALGLAAATITGTALVLQRTEKLHYRDRFLAKQASTHAEERYRTTLMSVGDAVIATDADSRVELMNPVAETLTGWPLDEARGQPLTTVFHIVNEQTRRPVDNPVQQVMREGRIIGLANHTMLIARDGQEYPIADAAAPIRAEPDGSISGVVLVFRDQTAERAAAQALRESESLMRSFFDNMDEMVVMHELIRDDNGRPVDYRILHGNPAFTRITGIPVGQAVGRTASDLYRSTPPPYLEEYARTVETGRPTRLETYYAPMQKWFNLSVVRTTPDRFATITLDITERRRLEQQLLQAQKLESIGTLASGVAHEINNPITGVMNYAQLIIDENDGDGQTAAFAGEIIRETERVASIVKNLLQFARQDNATHSPAALCDIVESSLSLMRTVMRHDHIDLEVDIPPSLPRLRARSQQLQQVLMNLLANARDALNERYPGADPAKRIRIEASLLDGEADSLVRLCVEDSGVGIAPEDQERVLDPFFTTKGAGRGTGLGLSISHGIVKEHGGRLHFESTPGMGARFYVDLPVCADGEPDIA